MDQVSVVDFATFYRTTKDRVFRSILLATRQPERSEDAVADAYTSAYRNWVRVGAHPNPVGYVTRAALNSFRTGWRVWKRESPDVPEIVTLAPFDRGIEPDLLERLWRLPRRQREVVALRILADLDTKQSAVVLGISPKTVTVHLHRALIALRGSLEGTEYEELA
jgi:DNA-directed RNA polymerase specialized sigma24 family protein